MFLDCKEFRVVGENVQSPEVLRENLAYFSFSLFKIPKMAWQFYKDLSYMTELFKVFTQEKTNYISTQRLVQECS